MKPLPLLYLSILLLSSNGLFAKLIPLDAVSIIQLRGLVAAGGLFLFVRLQGQSLRLNAARAWLGIYVLGVLMAIHWALFFYAIQISTVAVGMLSLFSYPVLTILLEPLFSRERLKVGDLVAGGVTFVGLAIMLLQGNSPVQGQIAIGVGSGVLSALFFALRNLAQKYFCAHIHSSSLMFHQAVAVALVLAWFVDPAPVLSLGWSDGVKIILLGLISTAGGHTLYVYCLKHLPAKSVGLISGLQPVIATFLAALVIGEQPGLLVIIGGLLVLMVSVYESLP
jgi:drug/metabolite transporter (DMT)-like permease